MNKLLIAFIFSVTSITTNAQLTFGIKAGANMSDTRTKSITNYTARFGFQAGAFCNIDIDKQFAVRPEILYAVKGYKFPAAQFNTGGTLSFNYINVPLLASYKASGKVRLLAGPELGFLLHVNSYFDKTDHDVSKNFNGKFDVSAVLGGIYSFTNAIAADIRFCYGLAPTIKGQLTDPQGNFIGGTYRDNYNISLQLGLNYSF
jgi:hypothetical protein